MTAEQPFPRAKRGGRKSIGGLALALLVAAYAVSQPQLNDRFGWQLPGFSSTAQTEPSSERPPSERPSSERPPAVSPATADVPSRTTPSGAAPSSPEPAIASPATSNATAPLYGLLTEEGNERYRSPAGLLYTRGSQEGHRLKHLERHVADDPDRPGPHGVFDGGMPGALVTVDAAYRQALAGSKTTRKDEDRRTVYTIDLGKRVGYVGGSEGQRRRNPIAKRVRLVLEQDRVITAYPL
ncbi:MAG: hypothetical protein EA381_17875 [Planctomycetaceae bacterium]|nr:MAG: hypothetical protein EA381_17875 [Planctomycetaceae bacterium]